MEIESRIFPLRSDDPRVSVGRFTYGTPAFRMRGGTIRLSR